MNHWLVKSEPGCWSWDDHVRAGIEPWDGVRNFQASKFMKEMACGDLAFFYHSQKEKAVVGVLEVVRDAYPDLTDESGRFVCVDFKALHPLKHPVTLKQIKEDPRLQDLALIKQSRLSVMPIASEAWDLINAMGGL
ncbi:EVE domain-containing protein [Terasakiella sp. SH-1]|uniref:EVE domain-containing protein n=1 Tax=Terasakiella sp. SH-1 TaxID=2560057 RepID=UPI0010745661|nr:EVE domain-containing protein [Terasakiella sp. SH-1]